MNHVYRVIWSLCRNAFIVASEHAGRHGKRGGAGAGQTAGSLGVFVLGGLATAIYTQSALAGGVQTADPNTQAYRAGNGVQVIDIAGANAAGVSHNRYIQYNVDPSGQVLNNNSAKTGAGALQSQLAGQVMPNLNLNDQARVILNEVVANNRSSLQGYTEVLGGRADVIVANPYGITCAGCGFINTDRATLTTGQPVFGADGSVSGFQVNRGDILVTGKGLDGQRQDVLDLVARSVVIDGQVNGKDVAIVAGSNRFNYADRSVTAQAGDADKPAYAIDSTALGGMYANRIRLLATEGGVGVRMRGEAASASDFTLTAAGRIELNGKVSAAQNLAVNYTGSAGDAGAVQLNGGNAELSAQGDINVDAGAGGMALNGGKLTAGRDLGVSAASLLDSSAGQTRFATRDLRLSISGNAAVDGSAWGAGGAASLRFGGLQVGAGGANLYSGGNLEVRGKGDLNLASATLTSGAGAQVVSESGNLRTAGQVKTQNGLMLDAAQQIESAGQLLSGGDLDLQAAGLKNSGTAQAAGALRLGKAGRELELDNQASGKLLGDTLSIQAGAVNNAGAVQASQGTTITARSLNNQGQLLGSTVAGKDTQIRVSGTVVNQGTVQSAGALRIDADGALSNSGKLLALGSAQGGGNGVLEVAAQRIDNSGVMDSGGNLNATARSSASDSFVNNGKLQSAGNLHLDVGGALSNAVSAQVIADGALSVTSALGDFSLGNLGLLQGRSGLTLGELNRRVSLLNSGQMLTGGRLAMTGSELQNSGLIQAAAGTQVTALSLSNLDGGNLLASTVAGSQDSFNLGRFSNRGIVQSAGNLTITSSGQLSNDGTLLTQYAPGALLLSAGSLNNTGNIEGAGGTTLSSTSTLDNSGQVHSVGDLALSSAGNLGNTGTLLGDANVSLDSPATLTNSGRIQAGKDLRIGADGAAFAALNNGAAGVMLAANAMKLFGGALDNQGKISSGAPLSARLTSLTNGSASNFKAVIVAGAGATDSQITLNNALDNYGAIHANGNLTLSASGITNRNTGGLSSLSTLDMTARSSGIDNYGALYAGAAMKLLASSGTVYNRVGGTIDSNGSLLSDSKDFVNSSAVVTQGNIDITVSNSFRNETTLADGTSIQKRLGGVYNIRNQIELDKFANEGSLDNGFNGWLMSEDFSRDEELVGITLDELKRLPKAQILSTGSNGTLRINYGNSGTNQIAVLAATNVVLNGTGTFSNQDLTLYQYNYTRYWIKVDDEKQPVDGDDKGVTWAFVDPSVGYGFLSGGYFGWADDDDYDHNSFNPGAGWSKSWVQTSNTYPQELIDWARDQAVSGAQRTGVKGSTSIGAGIFASNFSFPSGTLNNIGSPYPSDKNQIRQANDRVGSVTSRSQSGADSVAAGAIGALNASSQAVRSGIVPGGPLSFASLNLTLPSNPNGYFVLSREPGAGYLIETNPLFAVGSSYLGSDYLARLYGYDTDTLQKRLGDADYEAYLIRQQLIQQTGNNVINGYANEAEQMKRLMDQAYAQGGELGLEFGKPLTSAQAAALTQDIVWMEEVQVGGQTVLAPRVYLAAATVASVSSGAVIAANDVNIGGAGLTNTGGTIRGDNSLKVNTSGDITNTSGTLRGGNVQLTSSGGSIVNQTLAETTGGEMHYATTLGKTGNIQASGDLQMTAAKDIAVTGAEVAAQGDASLKAGGDIRFDTVVDKRSSTTAHSTGNSKTQTITGSERNIGSSLSSGGNLSLDSGKDTTIAGSTVNAGGDLAVTTGGDFNVEARQDTQTQSTHSSRSGLGVGGGVWGSETTTSNDFKGTNAGSSVSAGGNAKVDSSGSMTLQGSSMKVAGDADIDAAKGINVLDGLDEERHSKTTETTTFLKVGSSGSASSGSETGAHAGVEGRKASAGAEATTGAQASGSGDLKFSEHTTTTSNSGSRTSVGSTLQVGGNLKASTDGTLKVQGSTVESGGDMNLQAGNTEVLSGRNETWSNTSTQRQSTGIFSDGSAQAGAQASAEGQAGVPTGGKLGAQAGASANAQGTATIGVRNESDSSSDYSLRNSGSTLKSGGNLSLNSQGNATFVGANVESGGDMNITAKNIDNRAAQDIDEHSSSHSSQTAGLYFGGDASAQASAGAHAKAGGTGAGGKAEASAGAQANGSAGLRYQSEDSSETSGSVTQQTSSFKAGGNLTRSASDTITDQGTQLEAGGDINQSAREIRDVAVSDSQYSSSDGSHHEARAGIGASAGGEAAAGANHKGETQAGAGASAGVGIRASYEGGSESSEQRDTTAVTTRYKAGGNINSSSSGTTQLIGTQMEAGGDVNLQAGSLDYQAARDTSSSDSRSQSTNAELKVDVVGKAGGEVTAGHSQSQSSSSSSTAQVGGISAGGNINIRTKGDTTLEGTHLAAGNGASIDAGGNVNFKAAHDTSQSQSSSTSVEVGGSTERAGSSSVNAGFSHDESSDQSDVARGGSIKAGSGGISIRSGGDSSFEGTQLTSAGDTDIAAKGNVRLGATTGTETGDGKRLELAGGMETNAAGSKKKGDLGAGQSTTDRAASTGTVIQSAGSTRISGGTVIDQQATIESGQGTQISGKLIKVDADNHDDSQQRAINLKMNQDPKDKPAASTAPQASAPASSPAPASAAADKAALLKLLGTPNAGTAPDSSASGVVPPDVASFIDQASPDVIKAILDSKRQIDTENDALRQKLQQSAGSGAQMPDLGTGGVPQEQAKRVQDLVGQLMASAQSKAGASDLDKIIQQAQQTKGKASDLTPVSDLQGSQPSAAALAQAKLEQKLTEARKQDAAARESAKGEQLKQLTEQLEAARKAASQQGGAASASTTAAQQTAQDQLATISNMLKQSQEARAQQPSAIGSAPQAPASLPAGGGALSAQLAAAQQQVQKQQSAAEAMTQEAKARLSQVTSQIKDLQTQSGQPAALPGPSEPIASAPAKAELPQPAANLPSASVEDALLAVQTQRAQLLDAQLKSQIQSVSQANADMAAANQKLSALLQTQQQLQQLSGKGADQALVQIGQLAAQFPDDRAVQQTLQQAQQQLANNHASEQSANAALRDVMSSLNMLVEQTRTSLDQKSGQQQQQMLNLQDLTNQRSSALSKMEALKSKMEAARSSLRNP